MKGATLLALPSSVTMPSFNPRTRGGCDTTFGRPSLALSSFNPRTREGCDWGAAVRPPAGERVSIHAPVKGATRPLSPSYAVTSRFNPRTREGCDTRTDTHREWCCMVSIHAPVKGATSAARGSPCASRVSIHAPVKGATMRGYGRCPAIRRFNPRTREGCDQRGVYRARA